MTKHTKLTKIMLWLFFVPLFIDWTMTYIQFIREGHILSEANPLFILVGSNHFIFMGIIIGLGFLWYWAITWEGSITYRWVLLSGVVWLLLLRGVAIFGHILSIINPVSIEVAQESLAYTAQNKVTWYVNFVILLLYLPMFLQWLTFRLFRIDYFVWKKNKITERL